MNQVLFKNEVEITKRWLFYIENEASALMQRDGFAIQNYSDRELFNPDMEDYLSTDEAGDAVDAFHDTESLNLNLIEEIRTNAVPTKVRLRFRKLKTKIKQVFCDVVHSIEGLDTKGIIKAVLIALIPAFATGIPALVLPIIIAMVAYLLKYGIEKTCPV